MTAPMAASDARPVISSSVNSRVLGGLLFVFGLGWLLKQTGVIDMPWSAVASLVLVALGLAMIVTARARARSVPLMLLGGALMAGLAIGSSNIGVRGGVGERVLTPRIVHASERYHLGIGDLELDLRHSTIAATSTITADVGVGHLQVRVPPDVGVRVDVDTSFGNAVVFGKNLDVHGKARDSLTTQGYETAAPRLHLILHVGIGQIDVVN